MGSIEARVRAQWELGPQDAIPTEAFRRALEQAVRDERERCAKIAEEWAPYAACHKITKKIRTG